MDWSDIKPWVVKLAPMLGTALGPMGTLAGGIIATALGAKDASPESIKAAIAGGNLTGDQIVALKKAEEDFAIQMQAMNIKSIQDLQALEYQDRDSARKREEAVKDYTPMILAYGVTLGFFSVIIYLLKFGLNQQAASAHDIILMLIGALGSAFAQNVMGYYFGGSSDANKYIEKFSDKSK